MERDDIHNRNFDIFLLDIVKSYQNEGTSNVTKNLCMCLKDSQKKEVKEMVAGPCYDFHEPQALLPLWAPSLIKNNYK